MGFMRSDLTAYAITAYANILRKFGRLMSVHGFIYYILIFGMYVQYLHATRDTRKRPSAKDIEEGRDIYTDAKIAKAAYPDMATLIGDLIQLRNSLAHWNTHKISRLISSLSDERTQIPSGDSLVHDCVRNILSTDWGMIKRELKKISPELNFGE